MGPREIAVSRGETSRAGFRAWSVALSVAVHALIASGVLVLAVRGLERADERERERERSVAEALAATETSIALEVVPPEEGVRPTMAGGATTARIDTGAAGRGGEAALERARHLADRNDALTATPESSTLSGKDQVQRIASARLRSSYEDRRSTTRPMELSFVLTGDGRVVERRRYEDVPTAEGALVSRLPQMSHAEARLASRDVAVPNEGAGMVSPPPALAAGVAAPGEGIRNGTATAHASRDGARITFTRPDLPEAAVSVPAAERGRVRDNVDSRQAVASAVLAIVSASYAGGESGEGRGGTEGAFVPGADGVSGAGSHPRPLGAGLGDWVEFDTTDPLLAGYMRRLKAKVKPALAHAFPRQAALEQRQGYIIVELRIGASGAVEPRLMRPSGIGEYDENCVVALRGLSPEPLPAGLGRTSLRVRGRFEVLNPVIR